MRRCATAVLALVMIGIGGCSSRGGDAGTAPSATRPAAPATPAGTAPASGPTAEPTASMTAWSSVPLTVTHTVAVPPVPVLVAIRTAAHPAEGFDRIVFDVRGPLPGYQVRYVSQVREDPSDRPVSMPGRRYLLITLRPAQAHDEAGAATVTERTKTLDYPMLKGYVLTGDFEGVVNVALGLDDVVGFRVGELPGRLYVDVAA
jgi:hypothetical protein